MKYIKKLLALALAVMLVMSLATTAFAAEGNSITITGTAGHTYEVYQIFTGDLSGNVLSNIVWGNGVTAAGQTALGAAATVAASLSEANIKEFQADVDQYLTNGTTMTANGNTYTLDNLAAGYYLVKDKDGTQDDEGEAYTAYIIRVVGEVSVNPKDSVPTVDKSVTSEGTNADDFEIGDTVTFILKATLGDNLDEYKTYKVIFHDTMSAGLTFKEYVSATLGTTDVKANFAMTQNGQALTFSCDDIIDLGAKSGDTITITYTATLNSGAEIGQPGNSNKVKLEYSNDPNWDADGDGTPDNPNEPDEPTGETPEDEVLVFTYELDVTKVNGANVNEKLEGAEFVLLNSDKSKVATVVDGKLTGWVDVPAEGAAWPTNTTLTSDANGLFAIAGLDADTYYLRETKAPAGYNLLASDVKVVISATLNTAEDSAALTALTISVDNGTAENGILDTGVVNATIKNNAGATLPETGGIGTTIFYVLGSVLVLAAVVLLVTKKRMASAK